MLTGSVVTWFQTPRCGASVERTRDTGVEHPHHLRRRGENGIVERSLPLSMVVRIVIAHTDRQA